MSAQAGEAAEVFRYCRLFAAGWSIRGLSGRGLALAHLSDLGHVPFNRHPMSTSEAAVDRFAGDHHIPGDVD